MEHRREQEPLDSRDARASFSGDLSEVALVDLVQTLEMGRRTGTLRLTDRAGRTAQVWLRDGRPVDCEVGAAQGEIAFHRLLRWTEGEFAVEFEPVSRPARITGSAQALVMEGLRRAEAWRSAVARLPDPGSLVEIDYRLLSDRLAEIPDDMNALLRLVDGRRTLGQVMEEAGIDDLAAAAMVERLFAERIVRVAPQRAQVASAAPALAERTPEPERVTWFSGPSEASRPPAPPSAAPAPPPAAPAPSAGAAPRSLQPTPAPAAPSGEPPPPRIVRFPPREKEPSSIAHAGERLAMKAPDPVPAPPERPHGPPARAVARRAPTARSRRGRALVLLALALVAVAVAWKRWRAEAVASAAGEYDRWLAEARHLREAGHLPDAIAGYRRALAARDTSAGEAELGSTLSEAARPAAAIEALRRAVELDAANAAAYIALGEACLGEQRLAEAKWAFERYLALEPQGDRADGVRAALERIK